MWNHLAIAIILLCASLTTFAANEKSKPAKPWRALHVLDYGSDDQLDAFRLGRENVLVLPGESLEPDTEDEDDDE